jgi:hypothetical protein
MVAFSLALEIDVGSFLRRILFIDRQSTALAALKYQLTKLVGEKEICEKVCETSIE